MIVEGIVITALSSAVTAAFVSGGIAAYSRHVSGRAEIALKADLDGRLEEAKAELARESDRLEAVQRRIETQIQTRYSWLYEERAKVMRDIYDRILAAEDAYDDFLRSWGSLPGQGGPMQRCAAARDAGKAFFALYRPQRLLFGEEIASRLDDLNRWFVGIANGFQRHLMVEGDEYAAFAKLMEEGQPPYPNHRARLEAEFRRLYGTLDEAG